MLPPAVGLGLPTNEDGGIMGIRHLSTRRVLVAVLPIVLATVLAAAILATNAVPASSVAGASSSTQKPLVVLVGGLGSRIPTSGGDWTFVRKRLEKAGYEVYVAATWSNAPSGQTPDVIDSNSADWGESARRLDHQLVQAGRSGRSVILVGHSMGGLIARVYAKVWSSLASGCEPLGIVQLGTPNKGSEPATLKGLVPLTSSAVRQLGDAKVMKRFNADFPNAEGLPIYRIAGRYFPKAAKAYLAKHRTPTLAGILAAVVGVYGTAYNDCVVTVDSVRGGPTAGWRGCAVFNAIHSDSKLLSSYRYDAGCLLPHRSGSTGAAAIDEKIMLKIIADVRGVEEIAQPRIAFVKTAAGARRSHIWKIASDGSGLRRLTAASSSDLAPAWSPKRDTIAFIRSKSGNVLDRQGRLMLMRSDGTNERELVYKGPSLNTGSKALAYSPNGRYLAGGTLLRNQAGYWTESAVTVLDLQTKTSRIIVRGLAMNGIQALSWSPDSSQLVATWEEGDHCDMGRIDVAGKRILNYFKGSYEGYTGYPESASWRPDGEYILCGMWFNGEDGYPHRTQLVLPDGTLVSTLGEDQREPVYSPDGSRYAFLDDVRWDDPPSLRVASDSGGVLTTIYLGATGEQLSSPAWD